MDKFWKFPSEISNGNNATSKVNKSYVLIRELQNYDKLELIIGARSILIRRHLQCSEITKKKDLNRSRFFAFEDFEQNYVKI